jgi:hypothetical protein
MAIEQHTSRLEKRTVSPEEIRELAEHLAARAVPKHTKTSPPVTGCCWRHPY